LDHLTAPLGLAGSEEARAALEKLVSAGADPGSHLSGKYGGGPASGPGRPVVGYVCSYVPEEVILAAGLHPMRLGAVPGAPGPVESSLQSFACSFARACLDGLLTHRVGQLGGVVFAHTCDSLRAAAEVWRIHAPPGWLFHFFNFPARVDGPGGLEFTAAEVGRLAEVLSRVEGARPVTARRLTEARRLVERVRATLRRLSEVRARRPDLFPGSAYIAAARGATVLDREEAAACLELVAGELETAAGQPPAGLPAAPSSRPRLLVTGGFLETEEPLRLVEEAGADIVADDLCLGLRMLSFPAPAGTEGGLSGGSGEPPPGGEVAGNELAGLARSYLTRIPCPAKHPPSARFHFILEEAERWAADGVVFLLQKFCDPHAFDYPDLRGRLEAAGLPSLLLEVEQGALSRGQAFTRLEAFVERLRERTRDDGSAGREAPQEREQRPRGRTASGPCRARPGGGDRP